jgi:hypothetical protein
MNTGMETRPLQERFQHLLKVLSSQRFLTMQGIANEVPFFICPYPPAEAVEMDRVRRQLAAKLEQQGVRVLSIDLYDLAIGILQDRGIWQRVLDMEAGISKDKLRELLQGVLDPEAHLVPAISARLEAEAFDILFLSGVGEVFPYIRSHNVLNNLQSHAKEKPTVMFFPGTYTQSLEKGASLDLFGRLHDDKYYRATNLFHYEV